MQGSTKIPITILNVHITCKICNGYFVDATTVIECLHTFCRSCIVKYLQKNKYCPVCDVQIHKTKPLLNIRPDKTLQDLVYKLVPRLFQNEMQKRRAFYDSHLESKPSSLEQCGEASYQHLLTPEETICLTLTYNGCRDKPRYLRCPAAVSMAHLKKLICAKYDLSDNHRVDIFYNQDCLNPSLTLMDVAYIYLWKRKEPIELTYRIYERTSKRPKLELEYVETTQMNNNNWKEVQLRISENGEMSITGIQDDTLSPSLLEIVNSEPKYKNDDSAEDSKSPNKNVGKKELPALKYIGKGNSSTVSTVVSTSSTIITNIPTTTKETTSKLKIDFKSITLVPPNSNVYSSYGSTMSDTKHVNISISTPLSVCATLSSATTTTVYSTINSTKCSTKSEEVMTSALPVEIKQEDLGEKTKPSLPLTVNDGTCDKNLKRKNVAVADTEPPPKHPKQTILNHSLGLQNLSNNHPLKKHSKLNRNGENVKDLTSTIAIPSEIEIISAATTSCTTASSTRSVNSNTTSEPTTSKTNSVNKNFMFVQSQINTSVTVPKSPALSLKPSTASVKPPVTCYGGVKPPCYMPKSSYSPIINVPKPVTSTTNMNHSNKVESRPQEVSASSSLSPVKTDGAKLITTSCSHPSQQINAQNSNSKLSIKTKPSVPIGYKTLRDPPQSWNSQISKANLTKSSPELKYSDSKNIRPAKFFKMRNNMPRYLGNPASGVKPMYQLHVSPDKEKNKESIKTEKSEIKKHSIVKIDPKTLRPISEKAPETTSLSNHSTSNQCLSNHNFLNQNYSNPGMSSPLNNLSMQNDLKINTSSVSIFSPLKLQSSPKNERKSPKSPHSPKPKATSSPTGSKREKMNLNFTPSNPFIPNLSSTTLSPNQFLYPTGPPGFPPYDHRMMAAYHHLWYGQRMPFPTAPMPGLSLDLNQQRKNLEMLSSPTSPKMGALSQPMLNHQISSRPTTTTSNISSISRTHNLLPSPNTYKPPTSQKKISKDCKSEKSLENAVEKLTQNRHKAIGSKGGMMTNSSGPKNSGVEQKEKRGGKQREKSAKEPMNTVQEKNSSEKETKVEVKSEALSSSGCSVLVPSEISLPPTQVSKCDFRSNTCSDKSGKTSSEKSLSNSSSDNSKNSAKQDLSKVMNDDKTISKTPDISKSEELSSETSSSKKKPTSSVSNKKSHETSGLGRASSENKSEIKVEVSETPSSAVFIKTDADCAVQDISVSVNTTPCTVKVDEGVTGSNFAKVIKNNDSNHCGEDIILKGNGLC